MKKHIPYEKLSKKERREQDLKRRNGWGEVSPVTRMSKNKRLYNRKRTDTFSEREGGSFFYAAAILSRVDTVI